MDKIEHRLLSIDEKVHFGDEYWSDYEWFKFMDGSVGKTLEFLEMADVPARRKINTKVEKLKSDNIAMPKCSGCGGKPEVFLCQGCAFPEQDESESTSA